MGKRKIVSFKNHSAILTFLIFQFAATPSFGAPSFTTKSESSATETSGPDGVVQTIVNTNYLFTSLYNPKRQNIAEGMISQRIESTNISGKGSANPKLEAIAWVSVKGKYDTRLWTIADCADAGWQQGEFYVTSKYGLDGATNLLRAYNLKTGKYSFSFTTDPVSVDIAIPKDSIKRYISYASKIEKDSECRKNDLPNNAIGALTISDGEAQFDRVVLESDNEELARYAKISLINEKEPKGASYLSIWGPGDFSSKHEAIRGFSVKVTFRDGAEAIVPVANDKFDIQKASLPKTVRIHRIDTDLGKL